MLSEGSTEGGWPRLDQGSAGREMPTEMPIAGFPEPFIRLTCYWARNTLQPYEGCSSRSSYTSVQCQCSQGGWLGAGR